MSKHDGGPAFPVTAHGLACYGMTLRDYCAIHADIAGAELPLEMASAIVGRPMPDPEVSPAAALQWAADLDAGLRYMKADAMLVARNREPSE